MEPTTQAAREILALLEATYQPTHRYVPADPAHYPHLDVRWYDATSRLLSTRGFRTVRDVEDKTVTDAPGMVMSPVMLRGLLSRDGTIVGALYHPHIRKTWLRILLWLLRKLPQKTTDMETEFTDGSFVATSNAGSAGAAIENGPMILAEFLPPGTPPLAVLARHEVRVAKHLHERPGISARVLTGYDDMIASQHRMNALKAAYRGEVGMITREELDRLAGFGSRGLVPDIHAELSREHARRAG